ncbi:MAG: DUF3073 domain-containing protein [Bifidobacteriaceae bacterium]|jgi:hypothetical protein|nr:DUF3073 domain-containing protein [Bifidobacteriaceae bacterium]
MGRGRQKAKQTKVARKLKYYTPDTDYRALERELKGASDTSADDDPYAEYAARYSGDAEPADYDDYAADAED